MTRAQKGLLAGGLLGGYLLGLLCFMPASLVWKPIAEQLPPGFEVTRVQGTLWSGQLQGVRLDGLDHGRLSWQLQPSRLLLLQLSAGLEWRLRHGQVDARVKLRPGRLLLTDVRGELDAQGMAALYRAPFVLQGSWLFDINQLELEQPNTVLAASGRLSWVNAGAGLPNPMQLGGLQAELSADDGWLMLDLADQGGPLGLGGEAHWQPTRPMFLNTRLQARPGAEPMLAEALSLLGQPDTDGWVSWEASLQ